MEKVKGLKREILFRGKSVDTGEWVEGDFCRPCNIISYEPGTDLIDDHSVIPETIGQSTGLPDKNGKRIFEGDIVQGIVPNEEISHITANVVWRIEMATFEAENQCPIYGTATRSISDFEEFEVIGNVYDNPELLEAK